MDVKDVKKYYNFDDYREQLTPMGIIDVVAKN